MVYSTLLLFVPDYGVNFRLERRNLVHDDVPEDLQINAEISMDQGITETGNRFPVGCGKLFLEVIINILRSFTDDLKISHDRIDPHLIFREFFISHLTRYRKGYWKPLRPYRGDRAAGT